MIFRLVPNRLTAFVYDITATVVTVVLAFAVRLGFDGLPPMRDIVFVVAGFVAVASVAYPMSGLYNASWRYTSLRELTAIVRGVTVTVLGSVLLLFLLERGNSMPRTLPIISWFFLIVGLGFGRLALRLIRDFNRGELGFTGLATRDEERAGKRVPVLLYGFGDDAELFVRTAENRRRKIEFQPIGIIDDHPKNWGRRLRGVPVIGPLEHLGEALERLGTRPQQIIIMNDLIGRDSFRASLRQVIAETARHDIPVARFTGISDLISSFDAKNGAVHEIDFDSVLNRDLVSLDLSGIEKMITGNSVIITGAGGSIGSEIVRQVAGMTPSKLVLVDSSELALYTIDQEIAGMPGVGEVIPVLCDVRDAAAVSRLVGRYKPEVIFHAAALKHVPLVEQNPVAGIRTNVFGTINVANAAMENAVKAFVQISTDKAVHPTNVMGATKRLGEIYCQGLDLEKSRTRFVTVRFGNVLGSTGSVVPLFRRQIAQGGPVTVTHPEITRFFMTIQEAVQLVLKASAYSMARPEDRGKIFVLEMGEPVKIADLARKMIRMAGLQPGIDIEIRYTGLRPGEKLHEELFYEGEDQTKTSAEGVMVTAPEPIRQRYLKVLLKNLDAAALAGDETRALAVLGRAVTSFKPQAIEEEAESPAQEDAPEAPAETPRLRLVKGSGASDEAKD
ncbi:MAG: polysaccharide biosynthesis protein [Flavobacteriaceae bacterium]